MTLAQTKNFRIEWNGVVENQASSLDPLEPISRFISGLHTLNIADSQAWLTRAASSVSALIRPGTGCWIMDAGRNDETGRWAPVALAIEGSTNMDSARRFRDHVVAGFESEDVTGPEVQQFGVPLNYCLCRSDLYPNGAWSSSKYRALCIAMGVVDFARCVVDLEHAFQRRWLTVEVQGMHAQWQPDTLLVRMLSAVTYAIARAYEHRFLRLERHRAMLTARISRAGHAVLPLLAEGLSEAEISKRIHRSTHTVHDHVKQIYRVLGVSNRFELREVWMGEREAPPA